MIAYLNNNIIYSESKEELLVNIYFICHVYEARDLRKTRIYTINTTLEKTIIIH